MRDVDWRMCLRCMSEGEDGRPMVAPMFIAGSAIENVGGGHCPPDNPSVKNLRFLTPPFTQGRLWADRVVGPCIVRLFQAFFLWHERKTT